MFAVIAAADGTILERIKPPQAFKAALKTLRKLQRRYARSRRANPDGSNRQRALSKQISQAHADVTAKRRDFMHKLTTRLAKTHGTIVIEDLANSTGGCDRSAMMAGC